MHIFLYFNPAEDSAPGVAYIKETMIALIRLNSYGFWDDLVAEFMPMPIKTKSH